jgi:dihydroflavonol-4-reductase
VILQAARSFIDAVVISPTAIMGPYDFKPSYLGQALMKLYLNKLPMLVPGGYNWVDVRDVASGAISAAMRGRRGEKYLLSGRYLTLNELARMIEKLSGNKVSRLICPSFIAKMGVPFIKMYAKIKQTQPLYTTDSIVILKECNRNIQHTKATNELGFNPRPIEETLADTFEWYKTNGFLH